MDLLNEASEARKKTVNLSIRKGLINEAKELNLNLSKHAEEGIRLAVNKVREQRWLSENREAIMSHNQRIRDKGPLIKSHWME